ncbi:MAG: alpha/beta fold hydrolase [Pseudomonadales bacterium]|nr:alpha/beta fold hydrolase [Pseudomonadales bacterium]
MATITRDGVTLYYEVQGAGPAVLMSHGFSATSQMWQAQHDAICREHQLITWDMRGHGRSDSPEDPAEYTEEKTVADMLALLDHLDISSAVIGGLSLGGYMSLAFHLRHPERVRALMIIDTGPGYNSDKARAGWNVTANDMADVITKDGLAALASFSAEMKTAEHTGASGLIKAARGMMTQHNADVIQSLDKIKVPSLVLAGANDEPFLKATDYMAAKIADSTKVIISDAGHAANLDQPEQFNKAVLEFLGTLKS